MNIWILNHYAGTPHTTPATRPYDLSKELVRRGHQVTIFASSFSHYEFVEKVLQPGERWRTETCEGVRFIWLRTYPYRRNDWRRALSMLTYSWRAVSVGLRVKGRPDVIIGTCVHPPAAFSAYGLSVLRRGRFFFEITDLWPQTLVDMGALSDGSPLTWGLRVLERFLCRKAERIVTLLPHADEYLAKGGVPKDKVAYIPQCVDMTRFSDAKEYDGGNRDSFTVMYVGGHAKYQGLEVILGAAKMLQEQGNGRTRFVFVGNGLEKPGLIRLSSELNLRNVEFRDPVPKDQVARVMEEGDALVHSFRALGVQKYGVSPVKVPDYMAAGRPILYAVEGSNNPVEEARAGFTVPPEDPRALAEAITLLISMSPEDRIRMGLNGREYVRTHHDVKALVDRLEELLVKPYNRMSRARSRKRRGCAGLGTKWSCEREE